MAWFALLPREIRQDDALLRACNDCGMGAEEALGHAAAELARLRKMLDEALHMQTPVLIVPLEHNR